MSKMCSKWSKMDSRHEKIPWTMADSNHINDPKMTECLGEVGGSGRFSRTLSGLPDNKMTADDSFK
jgi:hypothetical protein